MSWRYFVYVFASLLLFAAACGGDDRPALPVGATTPPADEVTHDDDAHDEGESFVLDAQTVQHHWQALLAIRDDDLADASHHVQHIIAAVDGAHLVAMQEVAELIEAGDVHDAEHEIEGMLAGQAELDLSMEALHLQMALDALANDEIAESVHHLDHFVAASADHEAEEGSEILATIAAGDHHAAEERIAALIVELSGDEGSHDADADGDHDAHDEDARVITVVMREFSYEPDEIHVKVGEKVRLVLVNEGAVLHDITTEEFHGTVEAAEAGAHGDAAGMSTTRRASSTRPSKPAGRASSSSWPRKQAASSCSARFPATGSLG